MKFSDAMFFEHYLTSDFHTNTVISDVFAYSSKWRRKPGEGKWGKEFAEWYVAWRAECHNYAKYDLRGE